MGALLASVMCLCWCSASVAYIPTWVTWVVWQCSNVGRVGGILNCVALVILEEIPGWLYSVVSVEYFSNPFLKRVGNEYCSKLEKEFRCQPIYSPNISYFLKSPSATSTPEQFLKIAFFAVLLYHSEKMRWGRGCFLR